MRFLAIGDEFISGDDKKIQISCFGELSIYYDGIPVHLSSKKAYELIAYLIIHHGHPVSKWETASRLWENSEDFWARDSLYKVLKKIKQTEKEIGCSLVCSEKQKIYLEKDKIQCTLWEFEELYQNKSIANYEKAQQLFKEKLFGGEAYSWIIEEERRYELMYMEILENLLKHYQNKKEYHRIGYYQKLLGMKGV